MTLNSEPPSQLKFPAYIGWICMSWSFEYVVKIGKSVQCSVAVPRLLPSDIIRFAY